MVWWDVIAIYICMALQFRRTLRSVRIINQSPISSRNISTDLILLAASAPRSDPVCRGCDEADETARPILRFDWSQPRQTGTIRGALSASQFRRRPTAVSTCIPSQCRMVHVKLDGEISGFLLLIYFTGGEAQ